MTNLHGRIELEKRLKGGLNNQKKLSAKLQNAVGGVRYYEELPDKPRINDVELSKNKTAEELFLQMKMRKISNQEIEDMFKE